MKKIFQVLFSVSALILFSNSCSTIQYNETDEALGFGPKKCLTCEKACKCPTKFKVDSRYNIYEKE